MAIDTSLPEVRSQLTKHANRCGRQSSRGFAPLLSIIAGVEDLREWLTWADPDGCYGDEEREREGFDPLDVETAWDLVAIVLHGAGVVELPE